MRSFIFAFTALILAACTPNVESRGALKDADWKEQVKIGSTQEDVLNALGSPSAKSSFGEETWYYIAARRESFAFFKPEVTEQNITRITFEGGAVKSIDAFDKSQARDIDIAGRVTPTEGHSMGFMEQVLGNLGRFNSPGNTPGQAGGGTQRRR